MTTREIDRIIAALDELRSEVQDMRGDFNTRLEALETGEDKRRGRREAAGVVGKVIAVASAFIAALVALFGPPVH